MKTTTKRIIQAVVIAVGVAALRAVTNLTNESTRSKDFIKGKLGGQSSAVKTTSGKTKRANIKSKSRRR